MKSRLVSFAVFIATLAGLGGAPACGGGAAGAAVGSGSISGNVGGSAFSAQDAIAFNYSFLGAPVTALAIANTAGICAKAKANQNVKNGKSIVFTLWTNTNGTDSVVSAPGTYGVYPFSSVPSGNGNFGFGAAAVNDASCTETDDSFTSGSVVITAVSGGTLTGTLDVMTAGSVHLTGSFTAGACTPSATDAGASCN